MSAEQRTTTHLQLQAALDLAGVEMRASEVHGMVCGEICRRVRAATDADFPTLLGMPDPEAGGVQGLLGLVEELLEETRRQLDAGMRFELVLPDDEEPVDERTASLADWARGFVLALLRGDDPALTDVEGDSGEFLQDLVKISEARPGSDTEEDEKALAEIEEYIRVGVQLVFEELQPDRQSETARGSVH